MPTYLGNLPIRQDYVENVKVTESLILLLQTGKCGQHAERIFQLFEHVLEKQLAAGEAEDAKPLTPESQQRILDVCRGLDRSAVPAGLARFL